MTISKTALRRVRVIGTASMWLAGCTGLFLLSAWIGSAHALTGFHLVMIVFFSVLGALWIGCRAVLTVAEWRHDAALRVWQSAPARERLRVVREGGAATVATPGPDADAEPTSPAAA